MVFVRVLGRSTRSMTCSLTWVVDTARASSEVARGVNATSAAVDGVRWAWARRGREEGEKGGKGGKGGERFALLGAPRLRVCVWWVVGVVECCGPVGCLVELLSVVWVVRVVSRSLVPRVKSFVTVTTLLLYWRDLALI